MLIDGRVMVLELKSANWAQTVAYSSFWSWCLCVWSSCSKRYPRSSSTRVLDKMGRLCVRNLTTTTFAVDVAKSCPKSETDAHFSILYMCCLLFFVIGCPWCLRCLAVGVATKSCSRSFYLLLLLSSWLVSNAFKIQQLKIHCSIV